jgi:4-amino-4-deoxy-L-arabinose transferase-like glycosyltransferase
MAANALARDRFVGLQFAGHELRLLRLSPTGDYDATLCFFSTAYVCMLFFTLHRRRPRPVKVLAAGGLVACAVLTKNIAGLIPGTGVVVYILLMRRADTKIFHLVQIGNAYILPISP